MAERIGVSRPTVTLWRNRYLDGGPPWPRARPDAQ
ncbi:MAG: helix-turn-helix domain-containing protein [Frankiaceae bacterium]